MEIGTQIKQRRSAVGLSQEELADRIFVTRQTLSNWENDKTYPDINSLLRLAEQFHVSLDELVKGDIQTMEEVIKKEDINAYRAEQRRTVWIIAFGVLITVIMVIWSNRFSPVLALVVQPVMLWQIYRLEKLQKRYDIRTYKEIRAFLEGRRLDELETAVERGIQPYRMTLLILVIFLLGIAMGILVPPIIGLLGQ